MNNFFCYNDTSVTGIVGLCNHLKSCSYQFRFSDLTLRFGRSTHKLCVISNCVLNHVFEHHNWRWTRLYQLWLPPDFFWTILLHNPRFRSIYKKLLGTLVNTCRTGQFQKLLINGYKSVNAYHFQSVVTLNWLIANLFDLIQGRKHNFAMLRESNQFGKLRQLYHSANSN